MRIVVALGGNASLWRTDPSVRDAAAALAPIAERHQLIVCHGNGPLIGESGESVTPLPLDVQAAAAQGTVGYRLAQAFADAGMLRPAAVLVTQVVVADDDPAFDRPATFVGPRYSAGVAHRLAAKHAWTVAPEGNRWRRTVPSPTPLRVVEAPVVAALAGDGTAVLCGASVVTGDPLRGVEAVVDRDAAAGVLAADVAADRLVMLTDVDSLKRNFGTAEQSSLLSVNTAELERMYFPAASMGPKVDACVRFVRRTGNPAMIGSLEQAAKVVDGSAGTTVTRAPGDR
ncbi:MAG TPA: carbamate kinase [Pseudonocardiaceae bacterium]|jgi:carbamate kinase|nr:carbamate kinase [Pseudonocardiaceae bacterium]